MKILRLVDLYWHTLRDLKFRQIYMRLFYAIYTPKVPEARKIPNLRERNSQWVFFRQRKPEFNSSQMFKALGQSYNLRTQGWDDPFEPKLLRYHLHYFNDLQSPEAQLYGLRYATLIQNWIVENPPGEGTGWEPYPISIRIVNWIKWGLSGQKMSDLMLVSLVRQCLYLERQLEYHLMGNHLLANAKALVFAGLYFDGDMARRWLAKGLAIYKKQVPEQILPSGGHVEGSPMYHSLILEDLLDLAQIFQIYKLPGQYQDAIVLMLDWYKKMRHPDGGISFFNDSALNMAASYEELLNYGTQIKIISPVCNEHKNIDIGADKGRGCDGYISLNKGNIFAILDCAPIGPDYLPGHAHADTLSFECSIGEDRFLVNSGISTYEKGPLRDWQRSTAAHNTVCIDEENSSQIWSVFRVARKAYPVDVTCVENGDEITVEASHTGYRWLRGSPKHSRSWSISDRRITVSDKIQNLKGRKARAYFYFHPDVIVKDAHNALSCSLKNGERIHIKIAKGTGQVEGAKWYPEFGVGMDNRCLVVTMDNQGEMEIHFTLGNAMGKGAE